jgi:hypothetical protein
MAIHRGFIWFIWFVSFLEQGKLNEPMKPDEAESRHSPENVSWHLFLPLTLTLFGRNDSI